MKSLRVNRFTRTNGLVKPSNLIGLAKSDTNPCSFWLVQWTRQRLLTFTVVCSVTWPLSRSEAGGDFDLIQNSVVVRSESKEGHLQRRSYPGSTQRPDH